MTGLSLFTGIGGLDLAFEAAGGTVIAMCEQDNFCQKVLRKHWNDVPIFDDVCNLRGEQIGAVDIIFGGFPCQPFSVAGKRKGKEDERYLWGEFSRLVGEIKPLWLVAENVLGILSLAADEVCSDLECQGYSVGIWNYEAAVVGAPHRRARVFFVAHSGDANIEGNAFKGEHATEDRKKNADNSKRPSELSGIAFDSWGERGLRVVEPDVGRSFNGLPDWLDGDWERGIPRVASGVKNRADRLRALGNAVVPAQAYPIFKAIKYLIEEAEECI